MLYNHLFLQSLRLRIFCPCEIMKGLSAKTNEILPSNIFEHLSSMTYKRSHDPHSTGLPITLLCVAGRSMSGISKP
jgi:hypothetical protein